MSRSSVFLTTFLAAAVELIEIHRGGRRHRARAAYTKSGRWETTARGHAVLTDPRLNRGTAFTDKERRALDLVGLLPPRTLDLDQQATWAYAQYRV